jgi:hypothetical protein
MRSLAPLRRNGDPSARTQATARGRATTTRAPAAAQPGAGAAGRRRAAGGRRVVLASAGPAGGSSSARSVAARSTGAAVPAVASVPYKAITEGERSAQDRATRQGRGTPHCARGWQQQRRCADAARVPPAPTAFQPQLPPGSPEPLGPSRQGGAINFALYAGAATSVALMLHDEASGADTEVPMNKSGEPAGRGAAAVSHGSGSRHTATFVAEPRRPRFPPGDVWHVALEGLPGSGVLYGFRVKGEGGWETGYRWGGWAVPQRHRVLHSV